MKRINRLFLWAVIAAVSVFFQTTPAAAFSSNPQDWPQEIDVSGGKVVMYQPQPEELDGNLLKSRAAISMQVDQEDKEVFGAVWFDTRLYTDRHSRIATIADVTITQVRFSDQTKENELRLRELLEREMPRWDLQIDLDRLIASIDLAEKREIAAQRINTSPPKIIYVSRPAVLVTIDGEPRLKAVENSSLMRVINTPFTILFSPSEGNYYLYADNDTWYVSRDIKENWKITQNVPYEIASRKPMTPPEAKQRKYFDEKSREPGPPPDIIVSTEPAELISSTGEPEYTPISRTSLLYMSNTDSDVLLHIGEQRYYILLSGRWYSSRSLNGPWRFVAGEDLPKDFLRIPEESQIGTVLYAVPGTNVAREAILDAYIPQTAAIDPNKASLVVEYDGKPEFEPIPGTDLYYAVNTSTPVIWAGSWYYACDQAVWFVGPSPRGPWTVATSVPDSIYLIPPESPVYNVTFVRVYRATPRVVYVGYTPGYTHTYVYGNTIVYGTGYYWPGWYGRYYYPRPGTWGHHVRWNPWSGWAFGLSYGTGPFYFSLGFGDWYRGGWWGPGYYRGYWHSYYHGYRRGSRHGYRAGYRAGQQEAEEVNIYKREKNKVRLTGVRDKPIRWSNKKAGSGWQKKENDVYVDRQGKIYRKTDTGWQKRVKDKWLQYDSSKEVKTRPATGPVPTRKPSKPSEQVWTKPLSGPVPTKRPKSTPSEQVWTKPASGPVPTKRPKSTSSEPVWTKPASGPVPTKRPISKPPEQVWTKPATRPDKTSKPRVQEHDIVKPLSPQPSTGSAKNGKPVQWRGSKDPSKKPDVEQLDQSYRARQQGASRSQSFRGSSPWQGETPPQNWKRR